MKGDRVASPADVRAWRGPEQRLQGQYRVGQDAQVALFVPDFGLLLGSRAGSTALVGGDLSFQGPVRRYAGRAEKLSGDEQKSAKPYGWRKVHAAGPTSESLNSTIDGAQPRWKRACSSSKASKPRCVKIRDRVENRQRGRGKLDRDGRTAGYIDRANDTARLCVARSFRAVDATTCCRTGRCLVRLADGWQAVGACSRFPTKLRGAARRSQVRRSNMMSAINTNALRRTLPPGRLIQTPGPGEGKGTAPRERRRLADFF